LISEQDGYKLYSTEDRIEFIEEEEWEMESKNLTILDRHVDIMQPLIVIKSL
jgi:hypothetical protein